MAATLDRRTIAYSMIPFAFGLVHCSFYFFYVKVFLNVFKVSEWWFQFSQVIFMIWNTVNDPLIGYLMNNPKWRCSKIRRLPILYGGPIYALTFIVPWFPWASYKPGDWLIGVHLTFSLCLYDTLFSYIGLTACCLMAEMTDDYRQRLNLKFYGSLATILASWSVPFLNIMSDNLNYLRGFQVGSVILAIITHFALRHCGKHATTVFEETNGASCSESGSKLLVPTGRCCNNNVVIKVNPNLELGPDNGNTSDSAWSITKSIFCSRDFMAFIVTEFLECLHLTFWSSFTAIFVDNLVPIASAGKSFFFGLLGITPAILYILIRRPLEQYGYFRMYMLNIISKVVFSIFMWYYGPSPMMFLAFIFLDTVLGDLFSRMSDIVMADVTEKLMRQSSRRHPNSSILVGINALLTKPAHSLAPMVVVSLLNSAGYDRLVKGTLAPNSADAHHLNTVMFNISCAVPCFVGLGQIIAWSFYSIRSHEKTSIQENF